MQKARYATAVSAVFIALGLSLQPAGATPSNLPPPLSPILDLDGVLIPHSYTQFSVNFVASLASTNISFAMREDPAFIYLDDISVADLTTSGPNLLVNGGFEDGVLGESAPQGWSYLNEYGADFGGMVHNKSPHSGALSYFDGAVQAYDAITQVITTTPGDTYQINFWMFDNGDLTHFSRLSSNGDASDTGGNGADLLVYATSGPPLPADAVVVPEPPALLLLAVGLLGLLTRWPVQRVSKNTSDG